MPIATWQNQLPRAVWQIGSELPPTLSRGHDYMTLNSCNLFDTLRLSIDESALSKTDE